MPFNAITPKQRVAIDDKLFIAVFFLKMRLCNDGHVDFISSEVGGNMYDGLVITTAFRTHSDGNVAPFGGAWTLCVDVTQRPITAWS